MRSSQKKERRSKQALVDQEADLDDEVLQAQECWENFSIFFRIFWRLEAVLSSGSPENRLRFSPVMLGPIRGNFAGL